MEWKLFVSTFSLIFLAELGDKTQLAAFAASAGAKSPWSVFAGAALALVLSTFLAVVFGDTIQKYVPQHFLKIGAAVLFLVFGALLLVSVWAGRAESVAAPAAASRPGVVARIVLDMAAQFEIAATENYRALAGETGAGELRDLLLQLANEEDSHLAKVRNLAHEHGDVTVEAGHLEPVGAPEAAKQGALDEKQSKILAGVIDHERKKQRFYKELSQSIPMRSLRVIFADLAVQEGSHAQRLEMYLEAQV